MTLGLILVLAPTVSATLSLYKIPMKCVVLPSANLCISVKICARSQNCRVACLSALKSIFMATSQSLNSIMEEMVAKVMEDAVSTSIIFTQAPTHENGKEKVFVKSYNLKNISDILFVH